MSTESPTTHQHHKKIIPQQALRPDFPPLKDLRYFSRFSAGEKFDATQTEVRVNSSHGEAITIVTELGLRELIDPSKGELTVFRMHTQQTAQLDPASLDAIHKLTEHDDGSERTFGRVRTIVALVSGELSVRLHDSAEDDSEVIADLTMTPGDALDFDPEKNHSFVAVGGVPRLSYSIPRVVSDVGGSA